MINLILLVLSRLVMAIRAKKEWGLWFLAPHHSQLVASLHPSYMAAELIVCLVLWMIKLLLGATGWERRTRLTSIYMQGGFLLLPRHLEIRLFALFIGQSSPFQYGKSNSHSSITIDSRIQRAIIPLIIHSFCLEPESGGIHKLCNQHVILPAHTAACLNREEGNKEGNYPKCVEVDWRHRVNEKQQIYRGKKRQVTEGSWGDGWNLTCVMKRNVTTRVHQCT